MPEACAGIVLLRTEERATLSAQIEDEGARDEMVLASMGFVIRDKNKGYIGYGDDYRVPQLTYELYMIAHGETPNNVEKRFQDDIKDRRNRLTKLGYKQVYAGITKWWEAYGEDFRRDPDAYVFVSSPAARAQQTYAVYRQFIRSKTDIDIAKRCAGAGHTDQALNELNTGNWSGKTIDEVRDIPIIGEAEYERAMRFQAEDNFVFSSRDGRVRDGESFVDCMKRIHDWALGNNGRYRGKRVFAFGHALTQTTGRIIFRTEKAVVKDGIIQRWRSYVWTRGSAEYITGAKTGDQDAELSGVFMTTVPERNVALPDVTQISRHNAEMYRQDIEHFVMNVRGVHTAYERADTDAARLHIVAMKTELIATLRSYAERMPRFDNGDKTQFLLRRARGRRPELYREIIAANDRNDMAKLVTLNAEALTLNYTIMRQSIIRAGELLSNKMNWMAGILLLESAMHCAEQLKAETFYRDFRNRVRRQTDTERSNLDEIVSMLLRDLELSMAKGDQRSVVVKRIGWKLVGSRLAEVKKALVGKKSSKADTRESLSAMLEQLADHYRPEGAPHDLALVARAFLQLHVFLMEMPLSEDKKIAAMSLIDQLIDLVGEDYVKIAVSVTFDDELTRIKSEFEIITSAEDDIDTINGRLATVAFLIHRLQEGRVLSREEQAFFKDALADCAEWLERGIVPEKESAAAQIREAQRICGQDALDGAAMERVRGLIEGTRQYPGIFRLLETRKEYCRNVTIYNAQKRLYQAYRDWSDRELLELLRTIKRFSSTNLTVVLTTMDEIDVICVSGPRSALYAQIRSEIDKVRTVIVSEDRHKDKELAVLIDTIDAALMKTRTVVPTLDPRVTKHEAAVIRAA
jgi:broad specificity phosphatase PhoE